MAGLCLPVRQWRINWQAGTARPSRPSSPSRPSRPPSPSSPSSQSHHHTLPEITKTPPSI